MHRKRGAYDEFDSIAEAKHHYRRCRTFKGFILSDEGVKNDNPRCAHCGELIADPPKGEKPTPGYTGNRAHYSPRHKKVAIMHYTCAWNNLLNFIFRASDKLI